MQRKAGKPRKKKKEKPHQKNTRKTITTRYMDIEKLYTPSTTKKRKTKKKKSLRTSASAKDRIDSFFLFPKNLSLPWFSDEN